MTTKGQRTTFRLTCGLCGETSTLFVHRNKPRRRRRVASKAGWQKWWESRWFDVCPPCIVNEHEEFVAAVQGDFS